MFGADDMNNALLWVFDRKIVRPRPFHVVVKLEDHLFDLLGDRVVGVATGGGHVVIGNTEHLFWVANRQTARAHVFEGMKRTLMNNMAINV